MCCFDPGDCNVPYFAIRSVPYFFVSMDIIRRGFETRMEISKNRIGQNGKLRMKLLFV